MLDRAILFGSTKMLEKHRAMSIAAVIDTKTVSPDYHLSDRPIT